MHAFLAIALASIGIAATKASAPASRPGPARAHVNWILKCQGCHRPDGSGTPDTAPPLRDSVARFTDLPGGRAYLGRVPGVADAALPDDELAELLNWTLRRFDPKHLRANFKPYTAQEIGKLRQAPLRTDAAKMRATILRGAKRPNS